MTDLLTDAAKELLHDFQSANVFAADLPARLRQVEQEARDQMVPVIRELDAAYATIARLREALTSEDEIAHGEAVTEPIGGGPRTGLGVCAYCDEKWPCRTQRGIDRALEAG